MWALVKVQLSPSGTIDQTQPPPVEWIASYAKALAHTQAYQSVANGGCRWPTAYMLVSIQTGNAHLTFSVGEPT